MWPSLSEQATARIFEALRAIAESAPQLARLTRAAERQADAATLSALVAYREHLATELSDTAARAIAASAIRALGRRLATQAAERGDGDEHAENDAPPVDDGLRYTAVTFLYPGTADETRDAIDEACAVIDADGKADKIAHTLANALDAATVSEPPAR